MAHHVRVGVGEPGLGYPPHHVKVAGRWDEQRFRPCHEPGESGGEPEVGQVHVRRHTLSSVELSVPLSRHFHSVVRYIPLSPLSSIEFYMQPQNIQSWIRLCITSSARYIHNVSNDESSQPWSVFFV